MKTALLCILGFLSFAHMASAKTFSCYNGRNSVKVSIQPNGGTFISDGARLARPSDFRCAPYVSPGVSLFLARAGQNTWGYRIFGLHPQATFIEMMAILDPGSTGRACKYIHLQCFDDDASWEQNRRDYYSPCSVSGDGCYGQPLPNGPS